MMTCVVGESVASAQGTADAKVSDARKIRLLVFTSLYPNSVQPRYGVFVEERLRKLVASGKITASVIAPVPWFPFRHHRFGNYAALARIPRYEERHGIVVEHPRYPAIPRLGMNVAPFLMYRALLPVLRKRLAGGGDFDLIDAHYFYPDGVAAARLGAMFRKPVVVTARGNDLTLLPNYLWPRTQILRAAGCVAAIATVSQALKDKALSLGVAPEKVTALRNGVDLERFHPVERMTIRNDMNLSGVVWLTVGYLIERKGVRFAIEALARTQNTTLLVAGDGPEESRLRRLAADLRVSDRVRFLGPIPHDELIRYYGAADALMHPASREGMPNVVLESLACGAPVIVAPFDGASELVSAPEAGEIAAARTGEAIAAAWCRLQQRMPDRASTRRHAEQLGWGPVVDAQCALYARVLSEYRLQTTE